MTWTNVQTISPTFDWQFTEPIEGTFFRFKHTEAPNNAVFAVAQVEILNNQMQMFSVQMLTTEKGIDDILELPLPGCFAERRIAVRRLPSQPTLEEEVRRIFLPGYLQYPEEDLKIINRSEWKIQIESSDFAAPELSVDLSPIQTQLNEISTKIDNLQSSGSSTGDPPSPITPSNGGTTTTKQLTYVSNGDANGVCYWLGTNYGQQPWTNPHEAGRLTVSMSSFYSSGYNHPHTLVSRSVEDKSATSNIPNSWMALDLGSNNKLICNYYSLQGDGSGSEHPRNWKLQGSNDQNTWSDLDTQTNNSAISGSSWFSGSVSTTDEAYRYFRILQTGTNDIGNYVLSFTEWEFYGTLITQQ